MPSAGESYIHPATIYTVQGTYNIAVACTPLPNPGRGRRFPRAYWLLRAAASRLDHRLTPRPNRRHRQTHRGVHKRRKHIMSMFAMVRVAVTRSEPGSMTALATATPTHSARRHRQETRASVLRMIRLCGALRHLPPISSPIEHTHKPAPPACLLLLFQSPAVGASQGLVRLRRCCGQRSWSEWGLSGRPLQRTRARGPR